MLTSFIDATGFAWLSEDHLSQFVPEQATHRPGRIIASLPVMFAGGGEHVSDLDVLCNSPSIFGAVPSNATVSRFVARAAEQPEAFDHGISTLMRRMRSRIWEAAGKRNPAALATNGVVAANTFPPMVPRNWNGSPSCSADSHAKRSAGMPCRALA